MCRLFSIAIAYLCFWLIKVFNFGQQHFAKKFHGCVTILLEKDNSRKEMDDRYIFDSCLKIGMKIQYI